MCTTCGCSSGEVRIEAGAIGAKSVFRRPPAGPLPGGSASFSVHATPVAPAAEPVSSPTEIAPFALAPLVLEPSALKPGAPENAAQPLAQTPGLSLAQGGLHFGLGPACAHAPGLSQSRMVQIEQDILGKNNHYAAANREYLALRNILALNLLSSPGSGKTTLLTETILALGRASSVALARPTALTWPSALTWPIAVIEGDQQTSNDAERIRATGAAALQINTGKGCHLDASMIGIALGRLNPASNSILMIENVGNLVCPASFDLGEAHKVVVLSVTEGEDKPLKYPDMFRAASLLLLNKIDLLPYLKFDLAQCLANARRVNPQIHIIPISATSGEGMEAWLRWLEQACLSIQPSALTPTRAPEHPDLPVTNS